MDEKEPEQLKFDMREPADPNQLTLPFPESELERLGMKKEQDEKNCVG